MINRVRRNKLSAVTFFEPNSSPVTRYTLLHNTYDRLLLPTTFFLVVLGALMIYSSTSVNTCLSAGHRCPCWRRKEMDQTLALYLPAIRICKAFHGHIPCKVFISPGLQN